MVILVKYLEIPQTQEGLDEQQAACTAIGRRGNVKQFVDVKERQQQINDLTVLASVSQTIYLIQRLTLPQAFQLLAHASCRPTIDVAMSTLSTLTTT